MGIATTEDGLASRNWTTVTPRPLASSTIVSNVVPARLPNSISLILFAAMPERAASLFWLMPLASLNFRSLSPMAFHWASDHSILVPLLSNHPAAHGLEVQAVVLDHPVAALFEGSGDDKILQCIRYARKTDAWWVLGS